MLVRSWNLFHGNTLPPQRRAFLDEMFALAAADEPAVLCVQEVPAWALGRFTVGDVAARPMLGPLPIPAAVGHALTDIDHGHLRSAFSGQGNGILLGRGLHVLAHTTLTLNPRRFRDLEAKRLGLGLLARLAWAKERRIVQALRLALPDGRTMCVANLHCTSYRPDHRIADAELRRAAWFVTAEAQREDIVVIAGDFNLTAQRSPFLRDLAGPEWGFSGPGPGIDHVLVRGAVSTPVQRWEDGRRIHEGRLLSDHAPVEVEVE